MVTDLQYEKLGSAGCVPVHRYRKTVQGTNFKTQIRPQFFILHVTGRYNYLDT